MTVNVTCGACYTCVITSTGSMYQWGDDGCSGSIVLLPRLLPDLCSSRGVVISVSARNNFTACVTKGGEVFTWGRGRYGKLGHGDESDQETPKRIEALALVGVKTEEVSCGYEHTAVRTTDGAVCTFGRGEEGRLGHGDQQNKTSPALVVALEGKHITQVQCGGRHTMALTSSGYVFTWGFAGNGALGHGDILPLSQFSMSFLVDTSLRCLSIPCLVDGLREHNVVQISSGEDHCAVLVDSAPSSIRLLQLASFNNKEHYDIVFMVENELIYANIDVLSQNCDYFAAMFRCKMRESIERVVKVPDCSKAAFLRMLHYVCLDDFTASIDHVVELWHLADMYQLEGLKWLCLGSLERGLSGENASNVLEEAENLSCPCDELQRMCLEFLERINTSDSD